MKVAQYITLDPLAIYSNDLSSLRSAWHARIGEHGLLEDYLISKGYIIESFEEIEVSDDFINFNVCQLESLQVVELTGACIHLRKKSLEPSLN